MVIIVAALAVVVYQYRRRRLGRALLLAGAGVLAASNLSAIAVALDGTVPPRIQDAFGVRRATVSKKDIAARVLVTDVPRGMDVRYIGARSTLRASGFTLTSDLDRGLNVSDVYSRWRGIEEALGDVQLLYRHESHKDQWVSLIRLDEADAARYTREAGQLTSVLNVYLNRSLLAGRMPLADGSVTELRSQRIEIVRVIRRATSCTVLLRTSHVETPLSLPNSSQFVYLLLNNTRGEAVASDADPVLGRNVGVTSLLFAVLERRSGFLLDEYEVQFPQRMPVDAPAPTIDAAWLDNAEFAIVETVPAGSVSRVITAEEFTLPSH